MVDVRLKDRVLPIENKTVQDIIKEFVAQSCLLNERQVVEREPWNNEVTADAIRHFAYGISDDNPLWLDSDYAKAGPFGRITAPPAFLCSVLYPVLHGAPVALPLSSLIVELGFVWHHPVFTGDTIRATARQNRINIAIFCKYRFCGNPVIDQPIFGYCPGEPAAVLPVNINRFGT